MSPPGDESPGAGAGRDSRLRVLPADREGSGREPPPTVRLRRELKLPTVADLVREDGVAARLPGRARSALRHLNGRDLRRAEQALPGDYAPLLAGPGHRTRPRRDLRRVAWLLGVAAIAVALLWLWP